jgi:hypothetical protein
MDNNLNIECVWYKSKRDFNKFVRSIDDPQLSIIDYSIIKNKLIKADPYNEEPIDSIIGLNIIQSLKNAVNPEKKPITTVVYSFKNLNIDTVSNTKDLINSITEREISFVLNVLNMDQIPSKAILSKFDFVKFVDNG